MRASVFCGAGRWMATALLLGACLWSCAESAPGDGGAADAPAPASRTIEDLNYRGGDAAMPPFSDSIIDVHSAYRQGMLRKGLAFRVISGMQYTQDTMNAPVPTDQQVYVGQGPYASTFAQPILSWDLRQLHMQNAQLYMGAVWNWVTWVPAGPKTLQLWALYYYKEFGKDRVELKTGYIAHNMNFVGMFVGGSTATGSPGVYAVLPFEAGMSYFPLTAPAFDVRVNGPRHWYAKGAAQRSIDPNGGPAEVARNHTGFRFDPHGDKLVLIGEGGYERAASGHTLERWLRGGYLHNSTRMLNEATGQMQPGNYCGYVLMDGQVTQPDEAQPAHGVYLGGSYMTVPEALNAYSRYYEARLYKEGTFRSRPGDVFAAVASRTQYSPVFTDKLVSQGKTVWRGGTTLTGNYLFRTSPGSYVSVGMTYLYGPAITPRVANGLTALANWTWFF